jgi:hypothetical protein
MNLGRPWLRQVKAVNYWDKGSMRIGSHPHHVSIQFIPSTSDELDYKHMNSSDNNFSSWTLEVSSTTSSDEETNDLEAELYIVDTLPQVITGSMMYLEDESFKQAVKTRSSG